MTKKDSQELLTKIGSVKRIKEAILNELTVIVGEAKAKIVWEYFQKAEG